jgi:cell division protein FtsL
LNARAAMVVVLLAACVASAISVVHARQQSRHAFIELSKLENERDELNTEFGRLQLEQATWTDTNRLEQIARGQLGMVFPGPAETVVIRN